MTHITRPTRILLTVATSLAAVSITTAAMASPAAADEPDICYEQVSEAQYRKFTAPTDDGPWMLFGSWWNGQVGAWHPDVGEVVEGPGNHPDGRYTYRKVDERTVNGDEVPCPTTPTTSAPETTIPAPTTTDHEACIPEGEPVTDVDTGTTYIYGGVTELGYDTCGQPIPDICVNWGDHFSTLWTLVDCTPSPDTTAVAATGEPPAPPTTATAAPALPETGAETWIIAALAAALLGGGYSLTRIARR